MVMILRVYAIYNQSRVVLGVLLVIYITEVVLLFISAVTYSDPSYLTQSILRLLDITYCYATLNTLTWYNAATSVQLILATVLCVLLIAQSARDLH